MPAVKKRLKGTAVPTQNLPKLPQSSPDISAKRYTRIIRKKKICKKDASLKLSDSHPYLTSILEKPQPSTTCNNLEESQNKICDASENSRGDTVSIFITLLLLRKGTARSVIKKLHLLKFSYQVSSVCLFLFYSRVPETRPNMD